MSHEKKEPSYLRKLMVDLQIKGRGVKDPRVLSVMEKVERHIFIPEHPIPVAYSDRALPLKEGQTISQPYMVAKMLELLLPPPEKNLTKVLEIGTGSGYQTALLAELFEEVVTVEIVPDLFNRAKNILEKLGYKNIRTILGDGSQGYQELAPYQGIIVSAASPTIPTPLKEQLEDGGILVIPVGDHFLQTLYQVTKLGDKYEIKKFDQCIFVPLVGKYGLK